MNSVLVAGLLLLAADQPHEYTYEDLLDYKCDSGKQEACQRLQDLRAEKTEADRIQRRVVEFSRELEQRRLMLDEKRPDLRAAYPLVMNDYFTALRESGEKAQIVSTTQLEQCASHYHNYWINKKLWWPNEDGQPDWEDIYVFIVDHYYGFCLKTL